VIPISLSLTNFLSYGEDVPVLDFSTLHVACVSGANGHGKSALLDAITWALWGEARKAGSERRPDAGLLRTGASQMQVAFEFALEGQRYRVIRGYRRRGRSSSGAVTLELQVEGPQGEGYRTLSEGGLRVTQKRLGELLRMSYDTFINSAFILQNRADEFTRRGARERKRILSEILALGRYDQLSILARAHAQDSDRASESAAARLEEAEEARAQQADLSSQVAAADQRLAHVESELLRVEAQLGVVRSQQAQMASHRKEMDHLQGEARRLGGDRERFEADAEKARNVVSTCAEILRRRGQVLEAADRLSRAQAEEAQLQEKLLRLRDTERRLHEVERTIAEKRHEVESRLGEWDVLVAEGEREVEEARSALSDRAVVEEGVSELRRARDDLAGMEAQLERRQGLEQKLRECERRHDEACSGARLALHRASGKCDHTSAAAAPLARCRAGLEQALEGRREAEALNAQLRELRDIGNSLSARIEASGNRLPELRETAAEAEAQRVGLASTDEPRCPLCGSDLSQEHRKEVGEQLEEKRRSAEGDIVRLQSETQALVEERDTCRRRYQDLKNRLDELGDTPRAVAQAEAALEVAGAAAEALPALQDETSRLQAELEATVSRGPEATDLALRKAELEALGYRPEAHNALRGRVRELAAFEARQAQLQVSEARLQKARSELPERRRKRDLARVWLQEGRFAPQAQEEAAALRREIADMDYSADAHRKLDAEIASLQGAEREVEKLESAERERSLAEARLEAATGSAAECMSRLGAIEYRLRELGVALELEGSVAQEAEELDGCIREARRTRDGILQERAGLQAQHARCEALSATRDDVASRLKQARREARVYKELTTAFGKDGIPALIIEQAVPEIEEEANRILSRLTDNRCQITLESLRDLKAGGTRETLDIHISDEMGERPYELYSGGEAFRVDFAIRIAVSRLLAQRAGTRLQTLVIDEGFGTQDAGGLAHLVEAIQTISADFEKILVITHVEPLKQAFPVRIEVTKYPDVGSRFEVIQ